jgi:hypothetical protein
MVGATLGISRPSQHDYQGTWPDMPQAADFDGFLYDRTWPSQHDMPTVVQTLRELPTLANYRPSHSKICRIYRNGFYIDGCATVWTIALWRAIFKWKQGPYLNHHLVILSLKANKICTNHWVTSNTSGSCRETQNMLVRFTAWFLLVKSCTTGGTLNYIVAVIIIGWAHPLHFLPYSWGGWRCRPFVQGHCRHIKG